jgi:hypothetical protein
MAASYTNLFAFLLTIIVYYLVLKPALTLDIVRAPQLLAEYTAATYRYLAIFIGAVILVQFAVNVATISNMCGGAITQNVAYGGFITFIPWTLIFGVLVAVMIMYPAFRRIFADVFGYYYIASSANKILTELLINKEVQQQIDADTNPAITSEDRVKMQSAADMIIKICGNPGVLINQLTPTNFMEYWGLLQPLMKSKYTGAEGAAAAGELQTRLFDLVVAKDNVGEAAWFIYTGVLIVSLVQMKIATRGCVNNAAAQQANYAQFQAAEKEAADKRAQAQSTVYTMT